MAGQGQNVTGPGQVRMCSEPIAGRAGAGFSLGCASLSWQPVIWKKRFIEYTSGLLLIE